MMTTEQLRKSERNVRGMRIFTTVTSGVAVALLVWAGTSLTQVPKIIDQLSVIQIQLSGVQSSKDARRDIAEIRAVVELGEKRDRDHDLRFERNERRIEADSARIRALELARRKASP